jgi:small subunit ribosomal protein S20
MANNKQADKRNRQREKRRLRNRLVTGSARTTLRKARTAVSAPSGGPADAADQVGSAISTLDRAVSKGIIKRRTASRLISRLTRAASK